MNAPAYDFSIEISGYKLTSAVVNFYKTLFQYVFVWRKDEQIVSPISFSKDS
jgi:hypothetical protein